MPFNPRAVTGIPTEPVGSLPRPQALRDATADYDAGRIDMSALDAALDAAVRDTIAHYEATGAPIISDGEQRRASFAAYPVADSPTGAGRWPKPNSDDGQVAIVAGEHGRRLPMPTGERFRYKTYAADTLSRSIGYTTGPMKQAVISPSTLALLYPLHEQIPGYTREEFERDLADECEKDIRSAFTAGAARVSIDFTDGRLTTRDDPRSPWAGAGQLPHFVELINRVINRFNARERVHIGVHTCSGADRGPADPSRSSLIPDVFEINAGYFLLQLGAESDRDAVCATIGKHLRTDADGVTPMAFIGVIDTRSPRVESAREVADALVRAADHIPVEQLGSTDDCGFSPFSNDPRPLRGLPDLARGIAFRKIRSRVEGTLLAAEQLGMA